MTENGDGPSFIRHYLFQVTTLLTECPIDEVVEVLDILVRARERERTVFTFGNGGSAAAASHFACDLAKGTINGSRKRFRVVCLSDSIPLMTAWANDEEYADIFAEQLYALLEPEDVVIGISGSGNSENVIRAIELAELRGAVTVGLTGFDGGRLAQTAQVAVTIPSTNMQHIEDAHMILIHLMTTFLRLGRAGRKEYTGRKVCDFEAETIR
jgi:D-sedoheptulose 7-phosphate isomerase